MSIKKAEVTKVKRAAVHFKEGGDEAVIAATETNDGFDIQFHEDFVVRLTKVQWKAMKKAVKALKKGKKGRVVEEPEPDLPETPVEAKGKKEKKLASSGD